MANPNLEQHLHDIELENSNLASLYVALSQLHSSLDVNEVLQVIVEIMLNFVGAEVFALLIVDDDGTLRPVVAHGVDVADVPAAHRDAGVCGTCMQRGAPHVGSLGDQNRAAPFAGEPIICIPLHAGGEVIGVMPVWTFLQQKTELSDIDHEIVQLMSKSAGTAMEAARLAMTAPPQPGAKGYYEAFAELIG